MKPEGSLTNSQQHDICSYPESDLLSKCPIPLLEDQFQYYPPIYARVFQVVSFPHVSPPIILYAPFLSPIHTTCPGHLNIYNFITRMIFGDENTAQSSSLRSPLHSPVSSSLLDPNILLSTLFSKPLSLHSSVNVSDQVSHPYKTTGMIIVLYILIFTFFIVHWEVIDSA